MTHTTTIKPTDEMDDLSLDPVSITHTSGICCIFDGRVRNNYAIDFNSPQAGGELIEAVWDTVKYANDAIDKANIALLVNRIFPGLKAGVEHFGPSDEELTKAYDLEHGPPPEPYRFEIQLTPFSKIEHRPVKWVWRGWIPAGMFMIWQGFPGLGKSMTLVAIAAAITRAAKLPHTEDRAALGRVIWVSGEESPSQIIRPRLEQAGADLDLVHFLDGIVDRHTGEKRPLSVATDLPLLEATVTALDGVAMIVIDTIIGFLGDNVNANANHEVRPILQRIADFSDRTGIAVVGINHLSKAGGSNASLRGLGAGAINAVARHVVQVGQDRDNPEARVLAVAKLNLCKPPKSIGFTIQPSRHDLEIGVVVWGGESDMVADDFVCEPDKGERGEVDRAAEWLQAQLKHGRAAQNKLKADAEGEGLPWWAVQKGKAKIGAKSEKQGMAGQWFWYLPPPALLSEKPKAAEDV